MDNNLKKKWVHRIFKYVFVLAFIAFLTLYLSQATGYYEYENHQKATLTEEQIKQFEQDVRDVTRHPIWEVKYLILLVILLK